MDAVIQFFMDRWPIATLVTFIIIGAVIGIVKLVIWITKTVGKVDSIVEKCKVMPCVEHTTKIDIHKESIDRLDKRLDRFEKKMDKFGDRLDSINKVVLEIQSIFQSKYKPSSHVFSQKFSPRKLNDKGEELFNQFGGKEFLDANEEMLFERISAKTPKTALDVEQDALSSLYEMLDDDIFNTIKLKVYNCKDIQIEVDGKIENYSVTMNDVCFVFSIDLRDRYLSRHPEVPQE